MPGKSWAGGRVADITIAPSDANPASLSSADRVCVGANDQNIINEEINSLKSFGGSVLLLGGNFSLSARVNMVDNLTIMLASGCIVTLANGANATMFHSLAKNNVAILAAPTAMVDGNRANNPSGLHGFQATGSIGTANPTVAGTTGLRVTVIGGRWTGCYDTAFTFDGCSYVHYEDVEVDNSGLTGGASLWARNCFVIGGNAFVHDSPSGQNPAGVLHGGCTLVNIGRIVANSLGGSIIDIGNSIDVTIGELIGRNVRHGVWMEGPNQQRVHIGAMRLHGDAVGNAVNMKDVAGLPDIINIDYLSATNFSAIFNDDGATNVRIGGPHTRARGTNNIASGATTRTVAHGLSVTPTRVRVTFREQGTADYGRWWVDTLGGTNFVLNVSVDPGVSNLDFEWEAEVY